MKRRGFFQACAVALFGAFLATTELEPVLEASPPGKEALIAQLQAEVDALTEQMVEACARAMWGN